jgi:hypothetical protein
MVESEWNKDPYREELVQFIGVISVLKRKYERDVLFDEIRNRHYPTKMSKFEVNYYIFD